MSLAALALAAFITVAGQVPPATAPATPISTETVADVQSILQKTEPLSARCAALPGCSTVTLYCRASLTDPKAMLIAVIDRKPALMMTKPALTIFNLPAAHGFIVQPDPPSFLIAEKILGPGKFVDMQFTPELVATFSIEVKLILKCVENAKELQTPSRAI